MDASDKKTTSNQSAVKTMNILETLAESGEPMRLLDLSKATNMNASTTLRFLNSLKECGYVFQNADTQKYMLTLRIVSIADSSNILSRMKTILRDILIKLAHDCNESVCLAVNQDNEVLYLDFVDGPSRILKATQRIGHRAPLYCTGVGKLMLLDYSFEQLKLIADKGMIKLTDNTITTLQGLKRELDEIKINKYAFDNEECENGLRCVAAPIFNNHNKVIAALSVTGPSGRLTDEKMAEIKKIVIASAIKSSKLLGY